jgi:hypothetical protein
MHFAYMDEAGNTGDNLGDADSPIHLIGALFVPEDPIAAVFAEVERVASFASLVLGVPSNAEMHGVEIAAGKGVFKGKAVADRLGLLEDLAKIVGALGLEFLARGVDKPRLAARYPKPYHPHDIALMYTIEDIERRARRVLPQPCRVLLVADEIRERARIILSDVNAYQNFGTLWGWAPVGPLQHVVDTVHFVSSQTNRAIQLADCITWIALRHIRMRRHDDPIDPSKPFNAAIERIWQTHIAPHTRVCNVWVP